MPIIRRTAQTYADQMHRLKSIDAFGQPVGAQAQAEGELLRKKGLVCEKLWALTPEGAKAMNDFYAGRLADKDYRPNPALHTSARS